MKKVVIAGTSVYGIENLGDDAMLNGFCKGLRAALPDVEITLLARHPSKEMDTLHGIRSIKNLEHNSKKESMGRWFYGLNPGDPTDHLARIQKEIEESDLVVIGGDPFAEISLGTYHGLAPYAGLLTTLAKFHSKPVMLYGIHMGRPLETEVGKELTRFCVENADIVTLREEFSRKVLRDMHIDDTRCKVLADTAFCMDPVRSKEPGQDILDKEGIEFKSGRVIGVNFRHEYWRWDKETWQHYREMLSEACDYMVEEFNADLLFIPNCTYDTDHYYEDDRPTAADIVAGMKNKDHAHQIKNKYNLFETLSLFPHLDMHFSNRRHSLIFAAVHGVPSVGCGGEWHIKPALDEISLGDMFIRIEDLSAEKLKDNLEKVWNNRESLKTRIESAVPSLREKALEQGRLAAELTG